MNVQINYKNRVQQVFQIQKLSASLYTINKRLEKVILKRYLAQKEVPTNVQNFYRKNT